MLGAAKADAFCPERACSAGIGRRFGIGTNLHAARLICPLHEFTEITRQFGLQHGNLAFQHLPVAAINSDYIAFFEGLTRGQHNSIAIINTERTCTRHAGLAHAACDHRRVTGHATARGQNALSRVHTVNVFRARLNTHQNDIAAFGFCLFCIFRREHDFACRSAGRSR